VEQPKIVARGAPETVSSLPRLRVLIVDDNKDAADTLSQLLTSMNQDVCTVYDGPAAIAAARTFQPELVLLDIGMPEISGYEVVRALRSEKSLTKPVMVAVTGWGQGSDREQAMDAGFDYHFVKPMSEKLLRTLLTDSAGSALHAPNRP
jgi:CheY-like chemotaxis protein